MSAKWFVKNGNDEVGPGTEEQIMAAYRAGKIDKETLVRKEGEGAWMPFKSAVIVEQQSPDLGQEWYKALLTKYAVFQGRASRREYWLNQLLILTPSYFVITLASNNMGVRDLVYLLIVLVAFVIPGLALSARRLHDINKSAWWLLASLIPFVGPLVLLGLMLQPSYPDENKYGHRPLQ
jgi:uncharacterized membrane protein YhaH (DUF805 family)